MGRTSLVRTTARACRTTPATACTATRIGTPRSSSSHPPPADGTCASVRREPQTVYSPAFLHTVGLVGDLCRRAQASLLRAELLEDISHALGIPTSALAMISVKESPAVATAAFQVLMVVERPPAALCEELLEVIVAAAESGAGAAIIGAHAATLLLWSSPSLDLDGMRWNRQARTVWRLMRRTAWRSRRGRNTSRRRRRRARSRWP